MTQVFENLRINQRIEIEEGSADFLSKPFEKTSVSYSRPGETPRLEALPSSVETWLIDPLSAPDFSLPDLAGKMWDLKTFRGSFLLLTFWTASSPSCMEQMRLLEQRKAALASIGLRIASINVDAANGGEPMDARTLQSFVSKERISSPVLIATDEVAGVYNIVHRFLFDRRRDLPFPASFLIDANGIIVKIYQGPMNADRLRGDVANVPRSPADHLRKALPFKGTLYQEAFQRNDFTYGVAFFQHGYLDQAEASFKQVIAAKPDDSEAHYNLGTLYLRRNALADARQYLERTVKLRPDYPEAWNNLGMLDAQEGQVDAAVRNFQQSLSLRPDYAVALANLGNLYRRQGAFAEADKLLNRALELEPDNPEVNYNLGMLYVRQDQLDRGSAISGKSVSLTS